VRQEVLDICAESSRAQGFEPVVRFDGAIDAGRDDVVANHLTAVLREALANVARHAKATTADVQLRANAGRLTLTVLDDGVGPGEHDRAGRGLENMQARSTRLGDEVTLSARPDGGAERRWTVPIS
jgi:signal transduction histidine kinase